MNVLPNEDERMIGNSARAMLDADCPPQLVREMEKDPLGYSPALWASAAELGWCGMCLPEAYGGAEMELVQLGIVLREVGRAVAPLPLLASSVAAITLARHADDALKSDILPGVATGETILTFAFQENDARLHPDAVKLTARADGDGFVLNGAKMFVDSAASAHAVLVVARTGSGLSLFLVDLDAPGVTRTPLVTLAKDSQSALSFDDVRVPRARLVGPVDGGWPIASDMLDLATALLCAQMVGATRRDIEMAFEYAKLREAFGRPIGSFQALQHMCADMQIWTDGGEMLTFEALWKMDQGLPAWVEVSQAKAFCNERLLAAARHSQSIHGGIGFMMEFDLHLWYRRIAAWAMRLGTSFEHRARIAQALIDQPGNVRLGDAVTDREWHQIAVA